MVTYPDVQRHITDEGGHSANHNRELLFSHTPRSLLLTLLAHSCSHSSLTPAHTPRSLLLTLLAHSCSHSSLTPAHTPRSLLLTLLAHSCSHSSLTPAHTPRSLLLTLAFHARFCSCIVLILFAINSLLLEANENSEKRGL